MSAQLLCFPTVLLVCACFVPEHCAGTTTDQWQLVYILLPAQMGISWFNCKISIIRNMSSNCFVTRSLAADESPPTAFGKHCSESQFSSTYSKT